MEFVQQILGIIKNIFEDREELPPLIVTFDGKKINFCLIPGQFTRNHATKDLLVEFMRFIARRDKSLVAIGFICESWMVEQKTETEEDIDIGERRKIFNNQYKGSLEFVPGRKEIVNLMLSHKTLGNFMHSAEIDRSAGKPKLLPFVEFSREGQVEGRFANIFEHARGEMN